VLCLLYVAVFFSGLVGMARLIPLEIIYCIPIVFTVVFALRARSGSVGVERVFWSCLAGANATLFACELLLVAWIAVTPIGPPPVAWAFHIMHAIAAACFIGLLVSMSRLHSEPQRTRLRWELDLSAVTVIVGVTLIAAYARPVMAPANAPISHVLLGAAYPTFGLVMLLGTLANVVGLKAEKWRAWDVMVAVSLSLYALAISLWPLWYTSAVSAGTSRTTGRGMLDIIQFAGHWILMMAALYRLTQPDESRVTRLPAPVLRRTDVAHMIVPGVCVVAVPLVGWLAWSERADIRWFVVYAAAATLLTALIAARGLAFSYESGSDAGEPATDGLTGVWNRGFLATRLAAEIEQSRRYSEPLSVVSLDLDDFGRYNEQYGHMDGDLLLVQTARLIERVCEDTCTVARVGGDEFAVIAPEHDVMQATVLARRLLDVIAIESGPHPGSVSMSAGVATFPMHAEEPERLLRVAASAVAEAKQRGKAGIIVFEDTRVPSMGSRGDSKQPGSSTARPARADA